MSTTKTLKLTGPLGLTCPSCNSSDGVYGASYPIFAWGVEGGSSMTDHLECSVCEHEWAES